VITSERLVVELLTTGAIQGAIQVHFPFPFFSPEQAVNDLLSARTADANPVS